MSIFLVDKMIITMSYNFPNNFPGLKLANGRLLQHMGTIPGWVGSGRLACDYNAISVQLLLQLPTGTELDNDKTQVESVQLGNSLVCKPKFFSLLL